MTRAELRKVNKSYSKIIPNMIQRSATMVVHTDFGRIFTVQKPIVTLGKPSITQRQISDSALAVVDSMRMTTGMAVKPAMNPAIAAVNLPRSPQTSC